MRGAAALAAGVAMLGGPLSAHAVGFIGKRVHAAGVDPAIVEVEHGANRYRQVDGVVLPANGVQRLHIFGGDAGRIMVHLVDETEQGFVFFVQLGGFQIAQDTPDQVLVSQ